MSELQRLRLATLAAGLWWGSLTALCFVVVPLLFTHLPSPAIAGSMAARLFSAQTWLSCGCALLLLMAVSRSDSYTLAAWSQALMRPLVAGFLLALLLERQIGPNVRIRLASPYPLTGYKNTDASSTPDTLAVSADKSKRLPASGWFIAPPIAQKL